MTPEKKTTIALPSIAEAQLLQYLRELRWGTAEITVQNGLPVLIKAAVKTIKLAANQDARGASL